jgi:hypothetical protein
MERKNYLSKINKKIYSHPSLSLVTKIKKGQIQNMKKVKREYRQIAVFLVVK